MKRIKFLLSVFLSSVIFYTGYSQDCNRGSATAEISNTNSTAGLSFYSWAENLTMNNNQMFDRTGILMAGKDLDGNLKFFGSNYPGPLNPFTSGTEASTCEDWDQFFKVTKEEIEEHLELLAKDELGEINYTPDMIPEGVKGWPSIANPHFEEVHGFALPSTGQGLAGYFDGTSPDGVYDPLDGDFPVLELSDCIDYSQSGVEPVIPDEMIFWISNDVGGELSNSTQFSVGLETQRTAFIFRGDDRLDDVIFYRYKIISRALEDFSSTYFGIWADPSDCGLNEKTGVDQSRNLSYFYNQKDPTTCEVSPTLGIGVFKKIKSAIPKLDDDGNVMLDSLTNDTLFEAIPIDMSSYSYYSNPGLGNAHPATTDPQTSAEYFNYLEGNWRDGMAMQFGDDGHNTGGNNTKFAFPSNPDCTDPSCWSMCTENLGERDIRALQSYGPIRLQSGDVKEILIGTFTADVDDPECPDITPLQEKKDFIQELVDNCFDSILTSSTTIFNPLNAILLSPNPFSEGGHAQVTISNLPAQSNIRIYDVNGKVVKNMGQVIGNSINWTPDYSLSGGVYFVEVSDQNTRKVLKWVYSK